MQIFLTVALVISLILSPSNSSSRVCNGRRTLQFVQLLPTGGKEDHSARSKSEFRCSPATAGPIRRGVRLGASRGRSRLQIRCDSRHAPSRSIRLRLTSGLIHDLLLQEDYNITFSDAVKKASDLELEQFGSRPLLVPDWLAPQSTSESSDSEWSLRTHSLQTIRRPDLSSPSILSLLIYSEPLQSGPHPACDDPDLSNPNQVRCPSHWLLLLTRSHYYSWSVVMPALPLGRSSRHRSSRSVAGPRTQTRATSNHIEVPLETRTWTYPISNWKARISISQTCAQRPLCLISIAGPQTRPRQTSKFPAPSISQRHAPRPTGLNSISRSDLPDSSSSSPALFTTNVARPAHWRAPLLCSNVGHVWLRSQRFRMQDLGLDDPTLSTVVAVRVLLRR